MGVPSCGANRLGGNSLSDLVVFGKRAGEYAAAFAKGQGAVAVKKDEVDTVARQALEPFERGAGEGAYQVQRDLQQVMQTQVGIVRNQGDLENALQALPGLRARAGRVAVEGNREYNPGWHTSIDLRSLLTVSEAVVRSALERKESRGGHFREDYPDKHEEFGKVNLIVRKGDDGTMRVSREPVPEMSAELKEIVKEMK